MKNTKEIWKTIEEAPKYEVSSLGRVRNALTKKLLKLRFDKDGYIRVNITHNGKPLTRFVHRLMANAFIPNPEGLPIVNHKDEIKSNNRLYNLEWCDQKYNTNYGTGRERALATRAHRRALGIYGDSQGYKTKTVYVYDINKKLINQFVSAVECAKFLDVSNGYVSRLCKQNPDDLNFYKKGKVYLSLAKVS